MTAERAEVVIVGGGAVGSAAAYFLAAEPGFDGRVVVVERDPTYARASTPLSAGGIRQQFSIRENVEIGLFAREFIGRAGELLAVDGEAPDLGFVEGGYLFLAPPEGRAILAENHAVQTAAGAAIAWLEPDGLAARFPWLNVDGLAAGAFGERGEGWLDPNTLLQSFKRKARALGAEYRTDEVVAIERSGGGVEAVRLASGDRIECGTVLVAAGANAGAVARLAGVALPVGPRIRTIYQIDCREPLPLLPLTIDPSGVFVRPEGKGYICGVSPPEDQDPESWEIEVDWRWFEEVVWPALAHRVPAFEAVKLTGAWAGPYDYNALDQNAVIGRHPTIGNLLFATGFSGHGLQQSPAAGRAVMELVVHGGYRTIDLSRFGIERIFENRPLKERNVV
ncbi:MAG: FAD-binding oxidoreductase [Thalassobaculum sp.]|uniref:NAD(P)/FAD-dependent oxidoreductase n=1 Tax=Thalassobaculum sp. TaxID=2022740 RepID=UPI0032EEF6F8